MDFQARVLSISEVDRILDFEEALLTGNETEKMLARWQGRWRKEALDHYLSLGWSFAVWDNSEHMLGYFLAQPVLFFRGHTQSLWVEHVAATRKEVRDYLLEVACKWARDKHLQRVLFSEYDSLADGLQKLKAEKISDTIAEVKTT